MLRVVEDSSERGLTEESKDRANFIAIRHEDGTVAMYVHLETKGSAVKQGQFIRKGQFIAHSGNTGYSTGAHLHFEVLESAEPGKEKSVPVAFNLGNGRVESLASKQKYEAPPFCE